MKQTNRIEPININNNELTYTKMITTTQMDIMRRIEIIPINKVVTQLHSDFNQSFINHRNLYVKHSRKTLWSIACLFITVGIFALSTVITSLIITFKKTDLITENNLERYDLSNLYYGINHVDIPPNTYLSNINKKLIEKYFSNQFINQSGYHNLSIDNIFVQNRSDLNREKQRNTSCSIIFIIQNIQIYFEQCLTCTNKRNYILHHFLFNKTAFQQSFYLLLNNYTIFTHICSTPNISHMTIPIRLNISYPQKININTLTTTNILPLITSTFIDFSSTIVSTISFETTTMNNLKASIDFTTEFDLYQTTSSIKEMIQSSVKSNNTTKTFFQKPNPDMFQFLPFRPPVTIFPRQNTSSRYNNLFTLIKTNVNLPSTSTKRRKNI